MPNVKHISIGGVTYDIPSGGGQIMTAKVNNSSTTKIPSGFTVDTELDLNVGDLVFINEDTTNDVHAIRGEATYGGTSGYNFTFVNKECYILPAFFIVVKTYVQSSRKYKVLSWFAPGSTTTNGSSIKIDLGYLNDSTATMEDVLLTLLLKYKHAYINVTSGSNYFNGNLLPYDSSNNYVRSDESAVFKTGSFIYTIHKYTTAPTTVAFFRYSTSGNDVHLPLLFIGVGENSGSGSWPIIFGSPTDRYTLSSTSRLNNRKILLVKSLMCEACRNLG